MTLHSADPLPPAPSERFNFADHLTSLNRGRSAKPAYIDDVGVLTYGELADRVARFAGGLDALRPLVGSMVASHVAGDAPSSPAYASRFSPSG